MRHIILSLILFASATYAQNIDTTETPVMKAYNDFVNYTPRALQNQPVPPDFSTWKPDNISTLSLLYGYKDALKPTDQQLSWLKGRISDLAVALFLEDKPVLIRTTGGYSGCLESEYELKKEIFNGKEVIIVNFCHGCKGSSKHEDEFIKIFNNRTKRLLEGAR